MNERQVSEAVVGWIGDQVGIDDDANHRFPYPVANVLGAPPIVAGVADRKRTTSVEDEEAQLLFPQLLQLQQHTWIRVFDCSATIMVEVEEPNENAANAEAAARAQFQQLQAYGAQLEADAWADYSLGGRLAEEAFVSPALAFDYTPVFRELDGGVRGRVMALELRVGDLDVGHPE